MAHLLDVGFRVEGIAVYEGEGEGEGEVSAYSGFPAAWASASFVRSS